jgi:hypothetical protein
MIEKLWKGFLENFFDIKLKSIKQFIISTLTLKVLWQNRGTLLFGLHTISTTKVISFLKDPPPQ